jgi:hypothetical protein
VTHLTTTSSKVQAGRLGSCLLVVAAALGLALFLGAGTASAAGKQPVDFFGGLGVRGGQFAAAEGVAVNESGAGPADQGDIYVTDARINRIQRFSRDDNGTPADGADDTYSFLSAWGAGVDSSQPGFGYEVCTLASACQEGAASAADGGLSSPSGVAVDQDTGDVYVADPGNDRVSVYAGDGAFLRSFGFDVVASGPGDTGTGYEVCVPANGDVCKAGVPGSGLGQIGGPIPAGVGPGMGIAVSQPDGSAATGTVFLADRLNSRVNTYRLDGSSPASIGSSSVFHDGIEQPRQVAVDSRGVLYASNGIYLDASVERYDTENANGGGVRFLKPISAPTNEEALLRLEASSGQFRLSFDPDEGGPEPAQVTSSLSLNTTAAQLKAALESLPAIGAGNIEGVSTSSIGGHPVYGIVFGGALARTNLPPLTVINGSEPISPSGSVYIDNTSAATYDGADGPLAPGREVSALYVEPDLDGGGPDTDVLSVLLAGTTVDQFGPANQPGLSSPPATLDASFSIEGGSSGSALASDEASGRIYLPGITPELGSGVVVLDTPGPGPSATLDSLSDLTSSSVTAHATITPNGPPTLSYHLEYSTDGVNWESGPTVVLGSQKSPQAVSQVLDLGGAGLEPSTFYHLRLVAKRPFFSAIVTAEKTFTTLPSAPLAETMGSPVRTATTARLDGRIAPRNAAATYHFEYGDQGPCESNPCAATESHSGGSGGEFELVSQRLEGLQPNTTYHYRVIADNGNPGSPIAGEDMTVTTFASEAPLSHGHLPGPVGSDRAWELVSAPDTGGNPVGVGFSAGATTISDAGDRAIYGVAGGTPDSETGTLATTLFAQRTSSGWKTKSIYPSRDDATGTLWTAPGGPSDLSSMVAENVAAGRSGGFSVWRMSPNDPAVRINSNPDVHTRAGIGSLTTSDNGSRILMSMLGPQDPSHPLPANIAGLYDLSSGSPQLISFLPDGTPPPCGVRQASNGGPGLPPQGPRLRHIVSADGSLAFFPTRECGGSPERLFMRDIPAETTTRISTPPVSGPECSPYFIKSIPGTVFFYTQSRLVSEDIEPSSCVEGGQTGGGDVYSYDLADGGLDCLTCVAPGLDGEVIFSANALEVNSQVGVAEDGSRIYFTSRRRLLPGAPAKEGIYRLDVASGDIAYIGSFGYIGDIGGASYMNPSGSVVVFTSGRPILNALGGQQNGGTIQYYRYDDRDRSLICISCPADGSPPRGAAAGAGSIAFPSAGANIVPLSRDGEDFAFPTSVSLVPADQNTAGAGQDPKVGLDIYEWRAGRLLLVSDGLIKWPAEGGPKFQGITPSGHDIFFTAAAQYTQDALDGYSRLYDARIGGGFEFPPPPKPCPLEVCQGTPKGAPEEQAPGTATIAGAGNASRPGRVACAKPKRKVRRGGKTRCVKPTRKKHAHQRANHDRRTAR